jgi:hypothetical protein
VITIIISNDSFIQNFHEFIPGMVKRYRYEQDIKLNLKKFELPSEKHAVYYSIH